MCLFANKKLQFMGTTRSTGTTNISISGKGILILEFWQFDLMYAKRAFVHWYLSEVLKK